MKGIRLRAAPGELPLSFSQYDALKGRGAVYLGADGKPLAGAKLNKALAAEGVGLKRITIEGQYVGAGGGDLKPWRRTVEVPGTLDADGLARLTHQVARDMIQSKRTRYTETPPESYVTGFNIEGVRHRRPTKPRKIRGVGAKLRTVTGRTVYKDRFGKFITREKFLRLQRNAQRRATRKPAKRKR